MKINEVKFKLSDEIDRVVDELVRAHVESGALSYDDYYRITTSVYQAAWKTLAKIERERIKGA